jgi:integrase
MIRLTDVGVRNLKPKADRYEVPDAAARGLRVVVWPSGVKSYILRYRRPNTKKTAKLTLQAGISLAAARKAAADANYELQQGRDPGEAKKDVRAKAAAAAADTVQAICVAYMNREGKKLRSADAREKTLVRAVYPAIGDRPITSVGRKDLSRLFDQIEDERGPFMADTVRAFLSKIFHWHEGRTDDFISPITRGMARRVKSEDRSRDRVLTDDELVRVWRAADESDEPFPALIQFLLLTGARLREAAHMQWDEVAGADWLLPAVRNKVKTDLLRPLSKAALAVLERQPRVGDSPFVFTANGRAPLSHFSRPKQQFDVASGTSGWRLHDLRRTARSLMSRAGVNSDHAERCLGHVIGGVRGVYDRFEYRQEKAHAFEALASLIKSIVDPTAPSANVRVLRG